MFFTMSHSPPPTAIISAPMLAPTEKF